MGVSAMKAIITYDCKCDYCGRSLLSCLSSYENKPRNKRELNKMANRYGWFCDSKLNKNVCTDMACKIKRKNELEKEEKKKAKKLFNNFIKEGMKEEDARTEDYSIECNLDEEMKKYKVHFAEFDSDLHIGYEGEPFIVEANSYEEAEKKARTELEDAYYVFEFEVFEVEDDEDDF